MSMNLRPLMIAGALAACVVTAAASTAPAGETDIAGLAKKVYPSVVRVEVQNHIRRVATGVVVDRDGHIVTTALISPREEKITVVTRRRPDERGRVPGLRSRDPAGRHPGQGQKPEAPRDGPRRGPRRGGLGRRREHLPRIHPRRDPGHRQLGRRGQAAPQHLGDARIVRRPGRRRERTHGRPSPGHLHRRPPGPLQVPGPGAGRSGLCLQQRRGPLVRDGHGHPRGRREVRRRPDRREGQGRARLDGGRDRCRRKGTGRNRRYRRRQSGGDGEAQGRGHRAADRRPSGRERGDPGFRSAPPPAGPGRHARGRARRQGNERQGEARRVPGLRGPSRARAPLPGPFPGRPGADGPPRDARPAIRARRSGPFDARSAPVLRLVL